MSNGIITCKCGHEVADVPEPHPNNTWRCPACRRMGAFEWIPNAPLERELEDQMSKHTPGPWKCIAGLEPGTFAIEAKHKHRIQWLAQTNQMFEVLDERGEEPDEIATEANAKLFAAAPELLDACVEFVRKCECGEAQSRRSYAQMKAAIAKAEVTP